MPDDDQAEFKPPPPLPDGSMPTYGGHALPEDPPPPFGWGPNLSRLDNLEQAPPRAESPLLIVALIVLGGVAVSVLLAALSAHV
ncbi:hypothetical protein ACFV9C_32555 [Kribbella sp. NPDC059898]|uniref:hypothetical protein n=1 Tax=Kribbella sp. NPDC059898 TaxID=3346995 RepID=UPI00365C3FDE